MATYHVDAYGARAKVRDIGLVILFFVLTLGFLVYPQYWYYKINQELRDLGITYKDEYLAKERPGISVLAITLGAFLIIPPFVSYWRTTARIRQAQRITQTELTSGWVIFALYVTGAFLILPSLGIPAYVQSGLNSIWQKYPRVDPQAPAPPQVEAPTATSEQSSQPTAEG